MMLIGSVMMVLALLFLIALIALPVTAVAFLLAQQKK